MSQWPDSKQQPQPQSRFLLSITSPPARQLLDESQLSFRWQVQRAKGNRSPLLPARYRLCFYAVSSSGRIESKQPVFESAVNRNAISFDASGLPLAKGRMYGVKILGLNAVGEVVAESLLRRFGFRSRRLRTDLPASLGDIASRLDFLPHAPLVWGQLVRLRRRAELEPLPIPGDEEPGEGPGRSVEPMVWGGPAAVLYLVAELARRCNVRWDYSRVPGCSHVALQFAGSGGFAHLPGEPDALGDPNVVKTLWGPVTTCQIRSQQLFEDRPGTTAEESHVAFLPWLDLLDRSIWGYEPSVDEPFEIYLRLVPTDAAGHEVDVASDHVLVNSIGHQVAISFHDEVNTTWAWGEEPQRQIEFTVELRYGFDVIELPSTLIISTEMGDASPADWESHSQLFLEGEAVTETTLAETSRPGGAIRSMGSYVIPLTIWTHGQRLHFRLVETWSRHPAFWASGGALPFLNPTVSVWAFPGIGADAPFCGGPFTGEAVELPSYFAVTRSECVYANLAISSEGWLDFSGWNQLYTFFTSTFEGSCIRISRSEERWPPPAGDWEEWANEDAWDVREGLQHRETRNVEIEFWFAGAPTNGEEMYRAMSSAGGYLTAEMTERATDVVYLRQYAFEWIGRRATLTEDFGSHIRFGGPHGSHGTVVLNLPDRLEMDFTAMVEDSWEGDHGVRRYLDLSYRLNRR